MRRAGAVRVMTYAQLFSVARMLAMGKIARGERLAIVTNGHAPGILAADMAADRVGPMRALWAIRGADGKPMAEPPRWALALERVFDLAGNAAAVRERREDQITAGDGKIGRGARAFGADRAFRDLNKDSQRI